MRILKNNVLITPADPSKILTLSGIELFLDTRFEEQKNAPQSGVVVAIPEKLTFSHEPESASLSIQTTMELQVGDKVIFNYNAVPHCRKTGKMIGSDCLIPYDMIYVAIRGEEVICLNGGIIVEPTNPIIKTKLFLPDEVMKEKLKTKGIVRYASKMPHLAEQFNPEFNTLASPMILTLKGKFKDLKRYVTVDDVILFHHSNAIPLQHYHEVHGTLTKKLLYRMRHTDVALVIEQEKKYTYA